MPKPGDKIKHYELLSLLGKGGMGEVYLAQDTVLDRKVAIKFLPEEMQRDASAKARLMREAKAAASLDHPFICKIYETGEIDGSAYIVMEFMEGHDLRKKLDEEVLPLRDALQMALEIGEALEEAHGRGIVHRDLKPSNIMLTPQGHVKVMDFGLAKQILPEGEGEASITKTLSQVSITEQGAIVGTIAYMSPEQARGKKIDARSDIFSLGILIYEMTSGRYPFSKGSPIETLTSILRDSTPPVAVKPRAVNPLLSPILRKALAKDLDNRYQKVSDLISDIKKLLREITGEGAFLLRKWPVIAGTAVSIVILLVALWFFLLRPKTVSVESTGPEPISVLISDFQNQTGDPIFDGVLEQALGISIEGASFISVYNRQEALKIAAQLDPRTKDTLNEELAQLVSRSKGINAVVSGSIEPSDKGYVIKAWALDPVKANKVSEASEAIETKADVLKIADRIAAKLRSDLGDISADSARALTKETFTTSSLEAMKAYARGQELDDLGQPDEAIKEFQKALDHDPNFGRAYALLAVLKYNRGQYEEARGYFQEAIKRIDQMTDREKYRTRGIFYLMERDFKKAIEEYSALLEQYPGDFSAHTNLALAYFFARNMPKSVEEGRLDVKYNPESINARYNLSWYALAAGDFQTAEEQIQTVLEMSPDYAEVFVSLALAQLMQDRSEEAAATYQKLETLGTFGASVGATGLADLAIYEGRLADAIKILEKGIAFDLENSKKYNAADKYIMLAQTHLLQGKKDQAFQAVERALETDENNDVIFSAAQVYLDAGEVNKARALSGQLGRRFEPEPLAYSKLIGGELSRTRGDVPNALNLFQEAQYLLDTWIGHFLLGRAYLQAEAFTQAYSEFEQCLKRRGETTSVFLNDLPTSRYLPPIYYYLGRAQEGLGSDAASESYQRFLEIKKNNDGSDLMIEDARHRLNPSDL